MAHMVLGRVLMQHRPALLSVSLALALGACVGATDDEDPALAADGKADGFSPPWQGVLPVASGQGSVDVVFERPGGDPSSLAYVEFALSGPATISLETSSNDRGVWCHERIDDPGGGSEASTWGVCLDGRGLVSDSTSDGHGARVWEASVTRR